MKKCYYYYNYYYYYYYYLFSLFWEIFTPALADGFSRDSEWPQVSSTLLSILANLNNAVVWMVSICLHISKPSSPCTWWLYWARITTDITITFIFHSFFSSQARSKCLSLFLLSFSFSAVSWNSKVHNSAGSLFFCWLLLSLIVWLRLDDLFVIQNSKDFAHFIF